LLIQGKLDLPTDSDKVWKFVSDPSRVIQCAPGLQGYAVGEDKRVTASVKVTIGFIRGVFQTNTRLVKEDPKNRKATLELTGNGAGSGFNAIVNLAVTPIGKKSELAWEANVNINGPLGSLAKPLIEGNLKKIVDELFGCVKTKLS
jgi:carbon monoxide dehydrogenase subunit G